MSRWCLLADGKFHDTQNRQKLMSEVFPGLGILFCAKPEYCDLGILYQKWMKQVPLLQHVDVISISCKRLHQFAAIMVKITTAYIPTDLASSIFPFPADPDLSTMTSV